MNEMKAEPRGHRARDPRRERRSRSSSASCCSSSSRSARRRSTPSRMFRRVLVANRGEIAVRVIRALHELGVEAVAVYSTADARRAARPARRPRGLHRPAAGRARATCRSRRVVAAATTTGCEAVHPGYGFLAENPAFVARLRRQRPRLRRAGRGRDGADGRQGRRRRRSCSAAGVPLVPGHRGRADARRGARGGATSSAIPVLLKATAGGGGKGMRLVHGPTSSRAPTPPRRARRRRRSATARSTSRRRSSPARHVEIQVLCDGHGGVLTLGERECSIQRRHQKLIEESPSPALTPETREEMEAAAERACRAIGYENAGTFEFLLGPDGSFYFIELNARLQVEHPVSELVTGIDIVREQLRIAAGRAARRHRPRAARGPRDRDPASTPRTPRATSRRRPGRSTRFRPPLGPGRARRHAPRGGRRRPAVLRLAAREARSSGTRTGRRRSRARCGRSASSSSRACRRRASSRSTSSRSDGVRAAATTRRASSTEAGRAPGARRS